MISGTVYGVVLNDVSELSTLGNSLAEAPYKAPPTAPVVYIKPRNCVTGGGAPIPAQADAAELAVAPTLAVEFSRDVTMAEPEHVLPAIGRVFLALDVSAPNDSYYRPAVSQRCRDGFLPLGSGSGTPVSFAVIEIATQIDGVEAHRWSLSRLARPVERLIADLSAFMTLRAGDVLLVGLPGDAPMLKRGQTITVTSEGLGTLTTYLEREEAA
jgi:5-oxopent-3-ene-1,2,5-tricarboxylate decarboxylase/2-hydroxyhepta-2,4-diene-1,7-dioate isomerase